MPDLRELRLPVGYGAANLGNLHRELDDDTCFAILETAWGLGVRYFDTAPHYGLGLSERRLGEFLRTKPRDEFVLSTKAGRLLRESPSGASSDVQNDFYVTSPLERVWDLTPVGIRASIDESLDRMGMDRFDIVYLHDPERIDLDQGIATAVPALASCRASGLVDAIGVGSMDAVALGRSAAADIDVLMVAGRYTLLDDSAAAVLDTCAERGIDVVVASVFNSGLLASPTPTINGRFDYGRLPDSLRTRLGRIVDLCAEFSVPLPAVAIQHSLRHAAVASAVVGASRPQHIVDTVDWLNYVTPSEFWVALDTMQQESL